MSCLYISVSEGARGCRQRGRQGGILCWKRWKAFNCKGVKDVGEEACRVTKVRSCEGWRGEGKRDQSGSHALKDGKGAKEGEEKEGKRPLLAQTDLQNFNSPLQSAGPFQPLIYLYSGIIIDLIPRSQQEENMLFCPVFWYDRPQFSLDCEQPRNSLLPFRKKHFLSKPIPGALTEAELYLLNKEELREKK